MHMNRGERERKKRNDDDENEMSIQWVDASEIHFYFTLTVHSYEIE